jgi:hypothetical protein
MSIAGTIANLSNNHSSYEITLYSPASRQDLINFEHQLHCPLPDDIKAFYLFCNGFESAEDLFRIIPLDEICEQLSRYGPNRFAFAEYLVYCDTWEIEINPSNPAEYWISNQGKGFRPLTKSLSEFLDRFLAITCITKHRNLFSSGIFLLWISAGMKN